MQVQPVVLRPAVATVEEGRRFAGYVDQAADGFFGVWLGSNFVDIVAHAFLERDHDLSYENVTVAECQGVPTGMICMFTGKQHLRSTNEPLYRAAGGRPFVTRTVEFLFGPMMRVASKVPEDDFYVLSIAVDAEQRSGGVGGVLMDHAEAQARESGAARLSLDVAARNKAGRRFYERRGMRIVSRWPKLIPIPVITFYRMAKVL